jgi:membrane protein implicated in regulation of membrane protease activity
MEEGLGGKFWLWVIGVALAIGVGGLLLLTLISAAWYKWGFFGALLFFGAITLAFAWFYDRRQVKKYEEYSEITEA